MQDDYETVACARTYVGVSDRLPRDNYSPRYMRRLRAARYKPRKNSEECRGAIEKMECEMFSRTSALTRVRGTRSNRSPSRPASSPRCLSGYDIFPRNTRKYIGKRRCGRTRETH